MMTRNVKVEREERKKKEEIFSMITGRGEHISKHVKGKRGETPHESRAGHNGTTSLDKSYIKSKIKERVK